MSFPIYAGAKLISVAGLTNCIVQCSGNDSLPNESGLVSTSGTLVLRDPDGDRGRFDPVRNLSQFARGRAIIIGGHPRGYLRISNDQYSPATGELSLELADILTILNWKEPPEEIEYPKPGEPRSKFWLINYLLELAGAPALIDEIPGELECPLQRNSSIVALCGEIAASEGYYLWVDANENVRASEIMPQSSGFTIGSSTRNPDNSITLERVRASESPVETVRVHSNGCKPKPVEPVKEYIEEIWGAFIFVEGNPENPEEMTQLFKVDSVLLLRRFVRDEFNIVERIRIVTTTTEEVFYSHSAMFADPDNFDTNVRAELILTSELFENYFYSEEDGSLIQKVATEYKPFFTFDGDGVATANDPILWKIVTTSYEYEDEYTKKIEEIEERSVVQDGITNADLIVYRSQYQEWEELRPEQWRWVNRVMQALGSLNPNVPNAAKYTLVLANDESFVKVGNGGETQPPAIERHPALYEIEEFPISGEAKFSPVAGYLYRPRSHDYTMNFIEDEATCARVAKALGQLRWGRWFGCKVEVPFKFATNYRPGMRFSMNDPSARFNCVAEGYTWAFDSRSAVASWNGVSVSMPGGASFSVNLTVNVGGGASFLPVGATLIELGTPTTHDLPPGSSLTIGGVEIVISEFTPAGAIALPVFPTPVEIPNNSTISYEVIEDEPLYLDVRSIQSGFGVSAEVSFVPYPLTFPTIELTGNVGFGAFIAAPQPVAFNAGWGVAGSIEVPLLEITRTITINSTISYTNYPLLLTGVNTTNARSDGADIRFYDVNNNLLSYYLEPYSGATSRDIVVKVPAIANGTTTIYMVYRQGETTPQSTANAIASELTTASTQAWLCVSDISVTDNTPIQSITSRAGVTLAQPTLAKQAIFRTAQLGSHPALDFSTDDIYSASITTTSVASIFALAKFRPMSGEGLLSSYGIENNGNNNLGWSFGRHFQGDIFAIVNPGVGWSDTAAYDTNWGVFNLEINNTGTTQLLRNQNVIVSRTYTANIQNMLTLGGIAPNSSIGHFNGLISNFLVVNNCSSASKLAIAQYLSQRGAIGTYPTVTIGAES